jgi:hypothetical protein
MKLVEVDPGRRAAYSIFPGLAGEFRVEGVEGGSEFTAIIWMGTRVPVLCVIIDGILGRLLRTRIEAIRRHQAEEGVNLKLLLESAAPAAASG